MDDNVKLNVWAAIPDYPWFKQTGVDNLVITYKLILKPGYSVDVMDVNGVIYKSADEERLNDERIFAFRLRESVWVTKKVTIFFDKGQTQPLWAELENPSIDNEGLKKFYDVIPGRLTYEVPHVQGG